jgi:hypothetical protein
MFFPRLDGDGFEVALIFDRETDRLAGPDLLEL